MSSSKLARAEEARESDEEKVTVVYQLAPMESIFKFTFIHPIFHQNYVRLCDYTFGPASPFCDAHQHYMAIMAASRHHCAYLISYHISMYMKYDGDPQWLQGLYASDNRYHQLDELNRLLAHQPWLVSADLLQKLVARGSPDIRNTFTIHEVTHAALLLCHVHNMCSFIKSVGIDMASSIKPSLIPALKEKYEGHRLGKENKEFENGNGVETIVKNMRGLDTNASASPTSSNYNSFDCAGNESPESISEEEDADEGQYSWYPQFTYTDFKKRPERGIRDFKIHEFSWDHSYNLIYEFAPEGSNILDRMFKQMQKLTYHFMGSYESVDTTNYRLAVWNYVQLLFGIKHDDYNYSNTNLLLDRSTKTYIKNAACFPNRLTNEYENVMEGFMDSEKVHVVMIVLSSRLQSQLLHFGRALCNYNARTMAKKGYRRPLD